MRTRGSTFASASLISLAIAMLASPAVQAQTTTPAPAAAADDNAVQEIVVTGYRKSLAQSTVAKREAVGFSDSIFAEDIGKFPDTNIAESFNRIPGITISRDINGQGTNVAIRGLGSNFTQVTLNGAPIAVASSGATDAQGTDRSVDLSFFPTDLFTKLTVNKSYTSNLLEGGAAGNVDIRTARPFDHAGSHITYNLQGSKQNTTDRWGGRGSLIASTTGDKWGILVGVSGDRQETRVPGFETIGWTNANLSATQCGATSGCNNTGGGNYTIPANVPANAGNGLVAGTLIDKAFLLAKNPGLTIQQIDNALLPRLGGVSIADGRRERLNGVASVEFRPNDDLHFYLDGMAGYREYDYTRSTGEWIVRNGAPIPIGMTVDRADCSNGCVATGGTFANAQFYSITRPYEETNHYWGVNPGMEWNLTDNLKVKLQGNYTRSTFHRQVPSILLVTPASSGVTATYKNDGGIPTITSNVDLNNPASYTWDGGRLNIQDERRVNKTKGIRGDITWGDERLNLHVGGNYDDVSRNIAAYDNSQAWQNAVCGNQPSVNLLSPNTQPPCTGASIPGTAAAVNAINPAYPAYPGYGTGFTAGATPGISYAGSLVPTNQIPNFFKPGPDGFVVVDWSKFRSASQFDKYHDAAPAVGSSNTGANGGYIEEKTPAMFAEVNGIATVEGNDLRYNVGLRYVHTKQTIAGLVSLPDPRNTPTGGGSLPDGARYPNVVNTVYTESTYNKWLPAANIAYNVSDQAVVRAAVSRTMTRPDPNAQLPGVNFSAPSADVATIGNPALAPYMSTNIDLGFEFYTGQEGVISFNAFRKSVNGFTANGITTVPFAGLAQYGITYDTLTPTQQAGINARGGPTAATIQVTQQVNASGTLKVNGLEFQWVQPLDFLTEHVGVKGFGFIANATVVDQKGSGAAPAIALGVAPYTYNAIVYYEGHGVSLRVSDTFRKGAQTGALNQNGIANAGLFSDNYSQWDLSTIFDLEKITGWKHAPQVTFDVTNFTSSKLRTYFQYPNATFTQYNPGRQFLLGVRGTF